MSSIFTKIVAGQIPAYKVAEDDNFLAFLDINPVAYGHTLVIPKQEIDLVFDIPDDLYSGLFLFSKKVARGIEQAVSCERVGLSVVGLEVPHAHIHLIPINAISDMSFSNPRLQLDPSRFQELAQKISAAV